MSERSVSLRKEHSIVFGETIAQFTRLDWEKDQVREREEKRFATVEGKGGSESDFVGEVWHPYIPSCNIPKGF